MYFINAFKNEQSVCCFKSLSGSNFTVAIAGNNQNMKTAKLHRFHMLFISSCHINGIPQT